VIAKSLQPITTKYLQMPLYSIIRGDIGKAISLQLLSQPIDFIYYYPETQKPPCGGFKIGREYRIRTCDIHLVRVALYQLS
jgi:hypothetical protein